MAEEKGKFAYGDFPISQDLCKEWLQFFKDDTRVPDVEFPCSLKKAGVLSMPCYLLRWLR